ncbi:unnamed protein product [Peronospora belbahrii]|uniref:Uncharacterized protein n=1 Tax=Peronospora belbahrii TaxID=622444 RepID=A0ABN8D0E9_9STRA|nr:unnamed protein product [Peronospora belbahrii]
MHELLGVWKMVDSIWVALGFEHERELCQRVVDDVVKHERVRATSRVANRYQVKEVLGPRALGIFRCANNIMSCAAVMDVLNVESIPLGGAAPIVSEQVNFNVLCPQQPVRRLRHVDLAKERASLVVESRAETAVELSSTEHALYQLPLPCFRRLNVHLLMPIPHWLLQREPRHTHQRRVHRPIAGICTGAAAGAHARICCGGNAGK